MLKNYSLNPDAEPVDPLKGLDDQALLALRQRIDLKMKVEISNINLTEELGLQYRQGQALLAEIMVDKSVPANQKAQMQNSIRATLESIIRQQEIVYSAERLKRFETAFHKVLEKLSPESKALYFELYEEYLDDKGV